MNKSELVDSIAGTQWAFRRRTSRRPSTECSTSCPTPSQRVTPSTIQGWLKFEQVERAARTGHNPQTGEKMQIPASKAAKVTALTKLKAAGKGA